MEQSSAGRKILSRGVLEAFFLICPLESERGEVSALPPILFYTNTAQQQGSPECVFKSGMQKKGKSRTGTPCASGGRRADGAKSAVYQRVLSQSEG